MSVAGKLYLFPDRSTPASSTATSSDIQPAPPSPSRKRDPDLRLPAPGQPGERYQPAGCDPAGRMGPERPRTSPEPLNPSGGFFLFVSTRFANRLPISWADGYRILPGGSGAPAWPPDCFLSWSQGVSCTPDDRGERPGRLVFFVNGAFFWLCLPP